MNIYAVSGLINALLCSVLGLLVYAKNRTSNLNKKYAFFCFFVAFWSYGYFFWQISDTRDTALFWCRTLMAGAIFIPISFLHFTLILLDRYERRKALIKFGYAVFFIFFILDFTPFFVKGVTPKLFFKFWPDAGIMFLPFLSLWITYCIYACYLLFKNYKIFTGVKRNQIKYVLMGIVIGYIGGSTNYFLWYDISILPFGNFIIPFTVGLIAYAILKYRLMDIKVAVTRAGIFLTLYTLVLGFPFWLGYYTKSWLTTGSCMFVLASTCPLIYRFLISKAENMLLAQQKKYQRFLLHAAKGMVREHNLEKLLNLIVHVIKRGVKVQFAAVFLHDKEHGRYVLQAVRGRGSVSDKMTIPEAHPVIEEMRRKKAPLVHEEFGRLFGKDYHGIPIQLIVPASTGQEVLGFLVLGEKSDGSIYTEDDISVFSILSEQATLAIEHCLFLQEFKKQRDRIAEAEKLAGLGGMTSGIAHQFRNRLNVISQIRTNLIVGMDIFKNKYPVGDKEKEILKECEDTADGLKQEVDRCLKLIGWIIKYTKERMSETDFSFFPLKDCLDMAVSLVEIKHRMVDKERPFEFILDLGKNDEIWAIKGCIDEIMFNLTDNSYESIREKLDCRLNEEEIKNYRPFIKVTFTAGEDSYLIKVSDNGVGIKDEDKAKVFMPFFTTKASVISGMGIGMYMIDRLIREWHKGRIWFESEYMNGVDFFIELPKNKK